MGPVPNTNNINAVRPVVMLASRMEDRALLNPSATALRIPFLSAIPLERVQKSIHWHQRKFQSLVRSLLSQVKLKQRLNLQGLQISVIC